jgi:hypothetical protein
VRLASIRARVAEGRQGLRRRVIQVDRFVSLLVAASAAWPALAAAAPVSGPHETVDSQFTTTQPGAPAGFHYTGRYHAAGDPKADPPYMRKMVSYSPPGMRFDTSVPDRCTASDLQLALQGAAACPPLSRLGGGTADGRFMGFSSNLAVDFLNNADQQIILTHTPGLTTVSRGTIHRDGSVEFASPTCFPSSDPPGCPVDDALQLGSEISVPPFTRSIGGATRSYLTTAPTCPASGHWDTPIRFWWADGSVDTVVTQQPCTARATAARRPHLNKRRRHRHRGHAHRAEGR